MKAPIPRKHGEQLHDHELGRVHLRAGGDHARDGLVDHHSPVQGADDAHAEQEHVCPVEEQAKIRFQLFENENAPLSGQKRILFGRSTF